MNISGSLKAFILGFFLLGLLLALPSGITALFDGLPWAGEVETLSLAVIIPFLLLLGWKFLSLRLPILFLCLLLALKIVLFLGSPSSGWLIKIHPNFTKKQLTAYYPFKIVKGDSWVRTYASVWNEEASGILKNSWKEKLDFPLDWTLMRPGCGTSGIRCLDELNPVVEIDGVLIIPEGKKFSLIAKGVQEGTLLATNEEGKSLNFIPAKNRKEASQKQYQFLQSGRWVISGKLQYHGKNWSLIPTLVDPNGELSSSLSREVLWQKEKELSSSLKFISFYKVLSIVLDGGVILFLLAWAVWSAQSLVSKQILNLPLSLFGIVAFYIPIIMTPVYGGILDRLHSPDFTTISYLGFSLIITSVGFLIWSLWKKDFRNFQTDQIIPSIFLLFGPAILFFFANKWWSILGQCSVWGSGDDWTAYQVFARKIVVEGEWLNAGEGIFVMQPLYRYLIGIYHGLFGQSAFVQHMADVWCVLGATLIIVAFALKFRISPFISFSLSIVYLEINLIGALRYHIGKSLTENHAMIFMMLAAWFLYISREKGGYRLILATVFGIFGYWTRQDHLGAIAALAFLVLEPTEGPTFGWKGYWDRFQLHWKLMVWYWVGGILSILAICFRHWWLGEAFYFTSTKHPNFAMAVRGNYYWIFTGYHFPALPSLTALVLISGVFLAFLALVWRFKAIVNFPLSLGVIFAGLLSPYFFLWTGGYPPRYGIHMLPLALLSLVFLFNNVLVRYEWPFKEKWINNINP
jgi:hypothetical protein